MCFLFRRSKSLNMFFLLQPKWVVYMPTIHFGQSSFTITLCIEANIIHLLRTFQQSKKAILPRFIVYISQISSAAS